MKKFAVFTLCIMMLFAMVPTAAFAYEDEYAFTPEDENCDMGAEGSYTFRDEGSRYTMEDTSKYLKYMRIYAFYLGTGEEGDAVLLESSGKYLLMDTGHSDSAGRLVKCMRSVMGDRKNVDIYISHMHGDHTGGLEKVLKNFDVGTVYFPDIETCKYYRTPNTGKSIDKMYAEHVKIAKAGADRVVYLRPSSAVRSSKPRAKYTTDRFNVGAAVCKVMGPLGTYRPGDFVDYVKELNGHCGTKEGHCLNNCSLCTMVTCGNTKFLATGDIEKQEEAKLAAKYGSGLNAKIMKLPHHALRTSGTNTFVSKVTPMLSFAQDHGFTNGRHDAEYVVKKYGHYFPVATKKCSVAYVANKNGIRVYRDFNDNGIADDGKLKSWVVTGSRTQYFSTKGYIRTGWNWINGHAYYMGLSSGFRYTGRHTIKDTKVEFNSKGQLISHKKPSRVEMRWARAKGDGMIKIRWKGADRASRYQVYRAESKNGSYKYVKTVSKPCRAYSNYDLSAGKTYYFKVRAIRYVAGGTLYGSFSEAMSAKAR